jgi:hypothetical protein
VSQRSGREGADRIDDFDLILLAQAEKQRKSDQTIADALGDRTIAGPAIERAANVRDVERLVMEDSQDPTFPQVRDQPLPGLEARK